MNILEAYADARPNEHRIRRRRWVDGDFLPEGDVAQGEVGMPTYMGGHVSKASLELHLKILSGGSRVGYFLTHADLLATDWEVLKGDAHGKGDTE